MAYDPFADLGPPQKGADPFADLGPPQKGADAFGDVGAPPTGVIGDYVDPGGMAVPNDPLAMLGGAGASFVDLSKGVVQGLAGGLGSVLAAPSAILGGKPELIPQAFQEISGAAPLEPVWNAVLPPEANLYRQQIGAPVAELGTLPQAGEALGNLVLEKTGSPELAAVAATALQAAPLVAGGGLGRELLKGGKVAGKAAGKAIVEDIPVETLYKKGKKTTYTRADLQKILTQDPAADPVLLERISTDPAFKQTLVDAIRKGDLSVEELHPTWLGKILGKEPITTETPTETPPPEAPKGALPAAGETGTTPVPPSPDLMPGGQGGAAEPLPGTVLESKSIPDAANAVATRDMWIRQGFDAEIVPEEIGPGFVVTRRVKGAAATDPFADLPPVSPEVTPTVEETSVPQVVETPPTAPSPGRAAGGEPTVKKAKLVPSRGPDGKVKWTAVPVEEITEEPFVERRSVQTSGPRERRTDLETRKQIDAMTPEERANALRFDEKTGLKSHRAFVEEEGSRPVKVALDMNGLKWMNDNLGHAVGDDALRAVADVIGGAHGDGYRLSGDEMAVLAESPKHAAESLERIRAALKEVEIVATRPDGTEATFKGLTITAGTGESIDEAFAELNRDKEAAVERGDRSPERGGRPPGLLEVSAGRDEVPVQTPVPGQPTGAESHKEVVDDTKNVPGVPSNLRKGKAPVKTEPVEGVSTTPTGRSGVFFERKTSPERSADETISRGGKTEEKIGVLTLNTPFGEITGNRAARHAESIGNLSGTPSLFEKGYSSLDIPTRKNVLSNVIGLLDDDKIFDSIVPFIPVDVVDVLRPDETPAKVFLHDKAMFISALRSGSDSDVIAPVVDTIVRSPALRSAEVSLKDAAGGSKSTVPAERTDGAGVREVPSVVPHKKKINTKGRESQAPSPVPPAIAKKAPEEITHPLPTPPPGDRWKADRGAMPGEPSHFLDGETADDAKGVLIERVSEQGTSSWDGYLAGGLPVVHGETFENASKKMEERVDREAKAPPVPAEIAKPKTVTEEQIALGPEKVKIGERYGYEHAGDWYTGEVIGFNPSGQVRVRPEGHPDYSVHVNNWWNLKDPDARPKGVREAPAYIPPKEEPEETPVVPEAIAKKPSKKKPKSEKIKVAEGEPDARPVEGAVGAESPDRPAEPVREDEGERGPRGVSGTDREDGGADRPGPVEEGDGSVPSGVRGDEDVPAPEREGLAEPVGVDPRKPTGIDITPAALRESLAEAYKGGPKTRIKNNLEAIRTLKNIQSEDRLATPEEQKVLAKYVGWGGLPQIFEVKYSWSKDPNNLKPFYQELESLLTGDELSDAQGSTINAHYTDPEIVGAMWKGLEKMGLKGPARILEPAAGIGHFLGLAPDELRPSLRFTGVELDQVSGQIARQLYQNADIRIQGFQNAKLPSNFYDVAISNVPFSETKMLEDRTFRRFRFSLHNYFFAKTLEKVRPGGLIAFITTHYTMDSKDATFRKYLAERADLVGAVRLPNTAFKKNAGTEVVTDIIFLKKKGAGPAVPERKWENARNEENFNEYFLLHPPMVLGKHATTGSMYSKDEYTVEPLPGREAGAPLAEAVEERVSHFGNAYEKAVHKATEEADPQKNIPAPEEVKEGAYFIGEDKKVYQKEGDAGLPLDLEGKSLARMIGMIGVRNALRRLHHAQLTDATEGEITEYRAVLNKNYDQFVKANGFLHEDVNGKLFEKDPDYPLLLSIEVWDADTEKATKADIFTKRTVFPYKRVEKTDTPQEAMFVSMNETGRVDFARMRELTGLSETDLVESLAGQVFLTPQGEWQTADEYLSGNVREKLEEAEAAASTDPSFQENVEALKKVIPEDISFTEIDVTLGSPWIPGADLEDFIDHLLGQKWGVKVSHLASSGSWIVEVPGNIRQSVAGTATWGTHDYDAADLISATLNMKTPTVKRKDIDGKEYTDQEATIAARQKQQEIKDEFKKWIWEDADRRTRLHRSYNDDFNSVRLRTYDGSHLTLPGQAVGITLRPHQKNAIWRGIVSGNSLLAHAVGAGKTFAMIGIAMEKRRLGLAKKSIIAEPKHLIRQVAGEFLRLYPSANILVAGEKDFSAENRQKFLSRIATGDWDAVIITHEHFQRIPVSPETESEVIRRELEMLEKEILEARAAEEEAGGRRGKKGSKIVKQLEKAKDKLEQKLKALFDQKRDENVLTFEELGIDQIIVDESHKYKNLYFPTKMRNIAGLGTSDAARAFDMYVKTTYINKVTNFKGVVFSTGTPITNTMAEIFNVQRFLQPQELEDKGLSHFDSWAANFGEVVTGLEVGVSGKYVVKARFAQFINIPELLGMFRSVADIQTKAMLALPTPTLKGGDRASNRSAPTPEYLSFVKALGARAEAIKSGKVDPKVDNMLKITSDGRDSALDMRRINVNIYKEDPHGKVAKVVENVYRIWKAGAKEKHTQLIFCDRGTPTSKVEGRLKVYAELKRKLIGMGIPKAEIAFIHDAKNDDAKLAMFKNINDGKIRVLIGSTSKMGEGMNAQKRLKALHHLDVPWTPGLLEQREGRILRQGNDNEEVEIHAYVTQGSLTEMSFDAYMWQTLETKQKFVEQAMQGNPSIRRMEDVGRGGALSFAEMKAFATGNPIVMEKIRVDKEIGEINVLRKKYLEQRAGIVDTLASLPKRIDNLKDLLKKTQADLERSKKAGDVDFAGKEKGQFEIALGGTVYTDREKAGEYLAKRALKLKDPKSPDEPTSERVGKYRGFDLSVVATLVTYPSWTKKKDEIEYAVSAMGEREWRARITESAIGTIASLSYALGTNIGLDAHHIEAEIIRLEADLKEAKSLEGKKFDKEERFKALEKRAKEIDEELENKKGDVTADLAEGATADEEDGEETALEGESEEGEAPLERKVAKPEAKKFYRNVGGEFKEVGPRMLQDIPPEYIPKGYENFDVKVVKAGKDSFLLIEGRSGLSAGVANSKEDAFFKYKALYNAEAGDGISPEKFEEIVRQQIEKQGLSPRYKKGEGGTFTLYASPLDPELIAQAWRSLKRSTEELKERHRLAKSAKGLDLNWFNRQVNTPYYIFTEKFPRYRAVFDRMRQMMQERDDIAASLAEDAASFFSGLEFNEKDAVNKLLIKGRYQRKVWTREELERDGKLSTKQIDAYLGIRAMLDRALDIYENGIMYRITKGKMQASSNLPLPVIKDVLSGLGFEDDRIEQIAALVQQMRDTKRKGYAPFARFGNFSYGYVHVKEDGTPDWQNPSNYFAKEETAWKAAEKYQALLKRFAKGIEEGRLIPVPPRELKQSEEAKLLQEIGGFELDAIKKIMDLDPVAAADLKETVEQFFQAQGFRRHFFESKDSPGFSTDMERALADYIVSLSGFVARIKGIPEMDNAAKGMERIPDLARYYREWKNYSISPQEEFHQLRAGLFLYFLGGNVKSAAINLTQTFVTTIPWLTQYVSPFRATEEVTRAVKDLTAAMGKREDGSFGVVVDKLPKDIREIVRKGYDEGIVSEQLIYDLMGMAHKPSSLRKLSKQKQRIARGFGYLFSLAEKSNRLISLIASARIHQSLSQKHKARVEAFDEGGGAGKPPEPPGGGTIPFEEDPFEFGKRATDETQFIYAKYNRPKMFRGFGSLLGTFRTFVINFLEFLARLWGRKSAKAVGSVFVMLWAFSGLLGMPFAENVKYILEEVTGMVTHKKPDLETAVREWGYENMGGPEFMDYLLHGPFRQAAGFDIGASVGVGDVLPFFDKNFERSPLETIVGAPAEVLLKRPARAYGFLKEGSPYRAAETVAPEFLRNPMYAGRILKEGVLDRSGAQMVAREDVSAADLAKKALGFMPTSIAKSYEREEAKARIGERSEQLKKDATRSLLNAIRIGDREKAVSILKSTGPKPGVPPEEWIILNEKSIEKSLENTRLPPELRGLLRQPNLQRPAFLRMNKIYGGTK